MGYDEYRAKRQAEIDAKRAEERRAAEAVKPAAPEPKERKRSDSFWDRFFFGI